MMSNIKTECETVGTRSKRRKLATEKIDTSLYKTSNAMTIRDKAMFDTPDESLSELEEFKTMPSSPAYSKKSAMSNKCDDTSDYKIKINSNNVSGNKTRNKLKSPLNNEKTNMDHLTIQSIAENEEYISKSKSKQKGITSRNSLSSTPQKEIEKNKSKKLSLDSDVLNCKLEKFSNSPEFKMGKIKISSKEDTIHNKSNNKKNNTNFNFKSINEIEGNIRTRSKTRTNATPNDDEDSSNAEMPENKIQSSSEECSFNEPDFENSQLVKENKIEEISPIKANVKRTNTFQTNSESEEEFSESSEQSNLSIRENVSTIAPMTNQKSDNNNDTFSSETDFQSSKENFTRDELNAKTKSYSKSLKSSRKVKSKIPKKNSDVDFSGVRENSDESVINETQVQRVSSRVTHKKESKPAKGARIGNSKTKAEKSNLKKSISEESLICSPIISAQSPPIGKLKKTNEEVTASNPITPIKRKSQRVIKKCLQSDTSENEMDKTPKSKSAKKRTSTAKSPRTPLSFQMNEELGLSWDKKCTPARRYSLRLKKSNSESGTPRSRTSISRSSIGNTPTPSKRKKLLNTDLTNQMVIDSDSGSDSADYIPTNSKPSKQSSRKPAGNTSTKRKLKKLDMNDTDFSDDSDNNSPAVISSRKSTPRRTARKLSGKDSNQTDISNSTPKKTSQRKLSHK